MHDALALPFGLAIGILLGVVGGGGSVLAVPVLVYVLGEPVKRAITESLLIVGVTALVGALAAARAGRVRVRVALAFAAVGAGAAVAGTALNRLVDARLVLLGFGVLLLLAAYRMLRGRRTGPTHAGGDEQPPRWPRVVAAGAITGLLTGFFGIGGGFVIVPALTLALGLPMSVAVGTSLLVIALTSGAAFAAHLASGGINVSLALTFAASAMAGMLIGTKLHGQLPEPRLRQFFAVLLIAVAAFVIAENLAAGGA